MAQLLIAWCLFVVVGLSLWIKLLWPVRKAIACVAIVGLSITTGLLFGSTPNVSTGLVALLGIYQLINLLRLVEGRTNAKYLYKVSLKSALWLTVGQLLALLSLAVEPYVKLDYRLVLGVIGIGQFGLAIFLYLSARRNLRASSMPSDATRIADRDLPTITVCVPARNETDDLEACLKSIVHSNYPKLEILVLDDCSQNKRTPEIIRNFAQKGVKFLNGTPPAETWLAKNHAYQQLAEAANGEILLFCGVDTRFTADSFAEMVETMIQKKKRMVSYLPLNTAPAPNRLEDLMVQPGRYAWELIPPRRWLNRPPILSTCWLIYAEDFQKAGTLKAVTRSISPESHFAKYVIKNNDGYSFMIADKNLGFSSQKSFNNQRATAVRTRYPQVHRRPEIVVLLSLGEFMALVLPFILAIATLMLHQWLLLTLFVIVCLISLLTYSKIVNLTYRQKLKRGMWILPFAALYDIGLLNYSMWQYEFREVIWKGRNVCVPAMQVITELPKIKG